MRSGSAFAFVMLFALGGCAPQASVVPAPAAMASAQADLPPDARPNLDRHWLLPSGAYNYSPGDGFDGSPQPVVLSVGMLLDRFGGDGGNFFSPKGAPFAMRALPTVCERLVYKVYRVAAPLLAWTGKARPWFDQKGGATQFETDAPVYLLLTDHVIEPVPFSGEKPCEDR
jgi:hypothetical protein